MSLYAFCAALAPPARQSARRGAAGLCMQRRTVARLFDRGDDLRGRKLGFVVFDDHAVFQQVDRDLLRAGLLGDGLSTRLEQAAQLMPVTS